MDFMYAAQADKHAAYNQTPHSNERGLDRLLGAEDQPLDRPGQKNGRWKAMAAAAAVAGQARKKGEKELGTVQIHFHIHMLLLTVHVDVTTKT